MLSVNGNSSPNMRRAQTMLDPSGNQSELVPIGTPQRRGSIGALSLTLSPIKPEPLIVHPGAVISMLHLVPAISCPANVQVICDLWLILCMKFVYLYVCVYVCLYVCMYVCVYVCLYVYVYVCMYVCMYVCVHMCMYVCMHVFVFAVYMFVFVYVCSIVYNMYVSLYECVYVFG